MTSRDPVGPENKNKIDGVGEASLLDFSCFSRMNLTCFYSGADATQSSSSRIPRWYISLSHQIGLYSYKIEGELYFLNRWCSS